MQKNPLTLAQYAFAGWLPGGGKLCPLCRHKVWRFMPHRYGRAGAPRLLTVLAGVGSDTMHFECPHCGANDRERHLLLYLESSGLLEAFGGKSVLHFAPERRLWRRVAGANPASYVRCDLFPVEPDVQRVDMLNMPFEPCSFDVIMANHVLEHVASDTKALAEIHRVLKPGGYAILQTPFCNKLRETWEDEGIDTPEARLQAYGQEDHVRLFGRDIFDRIASSGLTPRIQQHGDLLPRIDPRMYGVNVAEPFMLFQRN